MRKIVLSVFAALCCAMGYAQDLPKIVPPSPESASLGKFDAIPVSHYTGLPNIGIPLYTIQEREVAIPINLSYHARGIQVEEVASRVGLGWTLSYGGSMSRQIRGGADDGAYGFSASRFKTFGNDSNKRTSVASEVTAPNDVDFFPDQYSFNANGHSGKFVMNYMNGLPLVQKYGDLKVEVNGVAIAQGFIVTDKDGIKYYFGTSKDGTRVIRNKSKTMQSKRTTDYSVKDLSSGGLDYYNGWMLTDIVTPNGGHVEFFYDRIATTIWKRSHDKLEMDPDVETRIPASYINEVLNDEYVIKEIRFGQGKVLFNASSTPDRQDISGGRTLESIEVLDLHGKRVKKYNLEYTYTTAVDDNNHSHYLELADPHGFKRLFLSKVREIGKSDELLSPYVFEYSDVQLPSRFSNSQDYWGYYNGATNGRYLTFYNYGTNIDRTVDVEKSEAGMLKKMTFPTKGYRTFTYEHNKGKLDSNTKNLVTNTINPLVTKVIDLSPKDHGNHYDGFVYTKNFVIGPDVNGGLMKKSISFADETGCTTGLELAECKFQVSIAGANIPHGEMMLTLGGGTISTLSPGNYTLKVRPINHTHNPLDRINDDFYVRLEWKEEITSEYLYAAGKRIKKIKNYSGADKLENYKEYSYNSYDDSWNEEAITSGMIFSLPNFYSLNEEFSASTGLKVFKAYGAGSGEPFSTYQANSIGYKYVTEYYGDQLNNIGKTVYKFTAESDAGRFTEFPYHLPTDNDWLRGLNLSTRVYNNTNGNYNLVKEITNEYIYGRSDLSEYGINISREGNPISERIPNLGIDISNDSKYIKDEKYFQLPLYTLIGNVDSNGHPIPGSYGYKVYHITGGTVDLEKTEEKSYFSGGTMMNTTEYFYNYDKHYQLSKTKVVNNKEEVFINETVFVQDKDGTPTITSEEQGLVNAHRVLPVEVTTFKDINQDGVLQSSEAISKLNTVYKAISSGIIAPEKVQSSKHSLALEDRVVYHSYDDKGNPTEVSKADGTRIVYVWGYNQTLPIAKIEGVSLSAINMTILSEVQTKSNWDINAGSETVLRTELQNLRASLPNAQVTTFTYDPLVGVTSITNPRGETMYYQYDGFNRLQFVKDAQGNILKENQYNYKN